MLRIYSEVSNRAANAVFSGVRAKEAVDYIRRIHQAEKIPLHPALERAFSQFSIINQRRNDIVHFGAFLQRGESFLVTNYRAAHTPDKARFFDISVDILNNMSNDLKTIDRTITMFTYGRFIKRYAKKSGKRRWKYGVNPHDLKSALHTPWRYKPPPQASIHHNVRGTVGKQRHRPRSSQA